MVTALETKLNFLCGLWGCEEKFNFVLTVGGVRGKEIQLRADGCGEGCKREKLNFTLTVGNLYVLFWL